MLTIELFIPMVLYLSFKKFQVFICLNGQNSLYPHILQHLVFSTEYVPVTTSASNSFFSSTKIPREMLHSVLQSSL